MACRGSSRSTSRASRRRSSPALPSRSPGSPSSTCPRPRDRPRLRCAAGGARPYEFNLVAGRGAPLRAADWRDAAGIARGARAGAPPTAGRRRLCAPAGPMAEPRRRPSLRPRPSLLLHLLLALPAHPGALAPRRSSRLPLELPAAPRPAPRRPRRGRAARAVSRPLLLAALASLKLADLAAEVAFRRPFNPVLDADLVPAGWRLLERGARLAAARCAVLLAPVLASPLLARAAWWATGRIARLAPRRGARRAARARRGCARRARRRARAGSTRREPRHRPARLGAPARRAAGARPTSRASAPRPRATPGRAAAGARSCRPCAAPTSFLIFVESYGRSALDNPLYAPDRRPRRSATPRRGSPPPASRCAPAS